MNAFWPIEAIHLHSTQKFSDLHFSLPDFPFPLKFPFQNISEIDLCLRISKYKGDQYNKKSNNLTLVL